MVTYKEIAEMIDHSLLKPTLTDQDIIDGCNLAKEYQVASVCVRPSDLPPVQTNPRRKRRTSYHGNWFPSRYNNNENKSGRKCGSH